MTSAPASIDTASDAAGRPRKVHRVEVHPAPGQPDPHAAQYAQAVHQHLGMGVALRSSRIYLIEAALADDDLTRIARELLADPVAQTAILGASPAPAAGRIVEVHYLPGVMDPVAQSTRDAILEMLPGLSPSDHSANVEVRTGFRFDFDPCAAPDQALKSFAQRFLANTVIQRIHLEPYLPDEFSRGGKYAFHLAHVPLLNLDDAGLTKLSRQGHLFLSLEEMKAIQTYFRDANREPTDIELETLAQTWSEHCVHKTLKSTIHYSVQSPGMAIPGLSPEQLAARPGHALNPDGSVTITNLLKSTVAAATHKLMQGPALGELGETSGGNSGGGWCVSVFKDNAGIVRFDETDAVCIKVETHNHPSAIEPYGGAATGIGGCIRDVMGTGLSARPIANTNIFCVAPPPPEGENIPTGIIHPRRILQQVVAGVRDYGNRMGIPTVNGAVYFHERYLGNPLVFAGCVGLIPLDKCFGQAKPGDRIIALGGRTGRDGIHGATFSSAELTDSHADEFAHAVQIGNAITQKQTLDAILEARDFPNSGGGTLFNAVTDCGAGGFSSAVGEMGSTIGAAVHLDKAPLKYDGLSYTEIWISEAQERMVLAVPPENIEKLSQICAAHEVEMCDLGVFGSAASEGQRVGSGEEGLGSRVLGLGTESKRDGAASSTANEPMLVLHYQGHEVGRLSMHFIHEGIPTPTRKATWPPSTTDVNPSPHPRPQTLDPRPSASDSTPADTLLELLAHPNIASKHWIIRQYDHEVQGGSVVKPLAGPHQDGPSDAAVLRPKLNSDRAIALACGLQTGLGEVTPGGDSYWMTLAAIDEAVRNVVCVGGNPARIALLDNFCWPRCDDPAQLGSLVRAAEACYDGALAYKAPFVSGKDSLSNQFTTEDGRLITIPPTLLITALSIVADARKARTMDAKAPGNHLIIVGQTTSAMGGSHYSMIRDIDSLNRQIPHVDLAAGPATAAAVASLIHDGLVVSAHDCSDGGLLVAAAEMAFAGRVGLDLDLAGVPVAGGAALDDATALFAESPSRYLLEITPPNLDAVLRKLRQAAIPAGQAGLFAKHDRLTVRSPQRGRILDLPLEQLRAAWRGTLDW